VRVGERQSGTFEGKCGVHNGLRNKSKQYRRVYKKNECAQHNAIFLAKERKPARRRKEEGWRTPLNVPEQP